MRKPRDFDGELKALQDKARDLKSRKVQQLGELVCESARGPDADRHVKLLIQFAVGGHFRALVHTLPRPLAVRSTIFARQTCFCGLLRLATTASRLLRSDRLKWMFVR